MPLLKAEFECEILTPMFLSGADQRSCELRAASLRGAMRWWFRAVAFGLDYPQNSSSGMVVEGEHRLFGGLGRKATNGAPEVAAQGSAVAVRVAPLKQNLKTDRIRVLPHSAESGKRTTEFAGIVPGSRFGVRLSNRPGAQAKLDCAAALFRLACMLGGFGRRSRRAFGSVQAWSPPGSAAPVLETADEAAAYVGEIVTEARDQVNALLGAPGFREFTATHITTTPVLAPNVATVQIGAKVNRDAILKDPAECLIGRIHDDMGTSIPTEERLESNVLGGVRRSPSPKRQASTMLVSVLPANDGDVWPVFTQFYCRTWDQARTRGDFDTLAAFPTRHYSVLTSVEL